MIVRTTTRAGAVILSKGETVGEIAREIGEDIKLVWRTIRQHCFNCAKAGKVPNVEPECYLWKSGGNMENIRVRRNITPENSNCSKMEQARKPAFAETAKNEKFKPLVERNATHQKNCTVAKRATKKATKAVLMAA